MAETADHIADLVGDVKLAIITDQTVERLHGPKLSDALSRAGLAHTVRAVAPGEPSKSVACASELWDWLADSGIGRYDVILAHGGGVINDLGGWVASAFIRQLRYVNLPTTVLAQVDAAMGGKVAVNHATAKNLIGAFYQPYGVVANVAQLATLANRDLRAGVAEAVKKAIIASPAYWRFLNEHAEDILALDLDVLEQLVRYAAAIKTELVERDPYERDLRRPLNYGHTIGHPLETVAGYGVVNHGEAVAFGMVVETRIAANRGLLEEPVLDMLIELLRRLGLPVDQDTLPVRIDPYRLLEATAPVELIRGGSRRFPLPRKLGVIEIVDDVVDDEIYVALRECGCKGGGPGDASMARNAAAR
jgi:3-dehydroquinate synthase